MAETSNSFYDKLTSDFDEALSHSGVNGIRMAERFYELSKIGTTPAGGVRRPGLSDEEKTAKTLVKKWMTEAGLTVSEDGAGNVSGILPGKNNDAKKIASGSHLDSVPDGGNFDGPLGVLSALEVVEAWKETGYTPEKPFELFIFTDEEGSRFNSGFTGSRAMTGSITEEEIAQLRDYNGETLEQVLAHYGSSLQQFREAKRDLNDVGFFAEVHIEQGLKLEQANQPVGIVSGIAGPAWLELEFNGQAGHAGNTPMIGRKDPLVAAAEFIHRVPEFPAKISDTAVATVGKMDVLPNGINVIPQQVIVHVDIRDVKEAPRDELVDLLVQEAKTVAEKRGIELISKQNTDIQPIPIAEEYQDMLVESLKKNDIKPIRIPSGAGHDAMVLGRHVPIAMLFVRSKDGISHNPKEWSSLNDCVLGVHALKDFLEQMMEK